MKRSVLLIWIMSAPALAAAETFSTDFEFGAAGSFAIGEAPLTATFNGGDAATPADPTLANSPTNAWLIEEGAAAEVVFGVPAREVGFFVRTEQASTGAGPCGVNDQGRDNTEAFGLELFARGGFNDWGNPSPAPPYNFVNFGDGVYQAEFDMTAGLFQYKLADAGWAIEYANADVATEIGVPIEMPGGPAAGGPNSSITIPGDGCYNFTLTILDDSEVPAPLTELLVMEAAVRGGDSSGVVRAFDAGGSQIASAPISDAYAAQQFVRADGESGVARLQFEGFTGAGLTAVDDFSFTANPPPSELTVSYSRPDSDYTGVEIEIGGTRRGTVFEVCEPTVENAFGCSVSVSDAGATLLLSAFKNGVADPAGEISIDTSQVGPEGQIYLFSGSPVPVLRPLPALPVDDPTVAGPNEVIVHYFRPDGDYGGWGLHLWEPGGQDWTNFSGGEYFPEGTDAELGAYFRVALPQNAVPPYSSDPEPRELFPEPLGFIIHRGEEKDPGPDQFIEISQDGNMVWVVSGVNELFTNPPVAGAVIISGAGAHWVSGDTLLWNASADVVSVDLHYSADANIEVSGNFLVGADTIFELGPGTNPPLPNAQHLSGFPAFQLPAEAVAQAQELLRGQLVAVGRDADGVQIEATNVQLPLVLDELYAAAAAATPLGASYTGSAPTLALWAPTARSVSVNLYEGPADNVPAAVEAMSFDDATGIWSLTGNPDWDRMFYTYRVEVFASDAGSIVVNEVSDPYSISLSLGSSQGRLLKSQLVNLADADLKPPGWDNLTKPALEAPEDIVLYELHVRDFSVWDDTVNPAERGKYTAFAADGRGRAHLAALAEAGLTHVHLLPSFDIATVNEDRSQRVEIEDPVEDLCAANASAAALCDDFPGMTILQVLESLPGDDGLQQEIINWVRNLDGFNWGYDPYHYSVPEGSYASDPDGAVRILEFRTMVQGLADIGLRTVMDVVYNHTNASGQLSDRSVLDRVVPGYYHRRNETTGGVLKDSCCDDTATEHAMMERLQIDSILMWAREYRVDGFRFDLMGFHPLSTMEKTRDALAAMNLAEDGVDGRTLYVYGEGWNFGDVQNDRRFVQATQGNMAGTGIGSFNDRLRDGLRGGGPFDNGISHPRNQGFVNGGFYDPNALNSGSSFELDRLLLDTDWIRVGMVGNLKAFEFIDRSGALRRGDQIDYRGQQTGYTDDPQEIINFGAAHDNETLWDIGQHKYPVDLPTSARVRAHNVGNALLLLGQGIPFLHAGQDMLRSKSMDRNSFDSGDWFNRLDFSYEDNNFAVGEPRNDENAGSITQIRDVLQIPEADPGMDAIMSAVRHVREMLSVRKSTRLFRLRSLEEVSDRVSFHNTGPEQIPGVIVQRIDGCVSPEFTPQFGGVVSVINANDEDQTIPLFANETFVLHPILSDSADPLVRTARHDARGFFVPGRTAAVFVAARQFECADDDADADGLTDDADNCIYLPNEDQLDNDSDGIGNLCDADLDNDCMVNAGDLGLFKQAFYSSDGAANWNPSADLNGDGVVNFEDLGRLRTQFLQNYTTDNPSGIPNVCN